MDIKQNIETTSSETQDNMTFGENIGFNAINGSQIFRKKLSDTYVVTGVPVIQIVNDKDGKDIAAEVNLDDKMLKDLDKMISYLDGMKGGFVGYLSWAYAMLTLFYITEDFEHFNVMLDMIEKCSTSIEKYIMTGTYDNNFINYWYGDKSSESSLQFAEDAYKTAMYVHSKAGSFESGYSLVISSILLYLTKNDMASANEECKNLRSIIVQLRQFSKDEQKRIDEDKKAEEEAKKEFEKGVAEKVKAVKGDDYVDYHTVEEKNDENHD